MVGDADLMIAGGTDSILNNFAYISFGKLGVLTHETCKPFDVNRNGAIAGECAGITVLVSEEGLKSLGLDPAFELIGFGNSMDAYKITAPDPSGIGIEKAMRKAINMSGAKASDIQYINAHGTGTRSNDEVELRAIERVVGDAAPSISVSSTKDRHGHSIAAAGIQEFHVLLASMKSGVVPANLNTTKPLQTNLRLPVGVNLQHEIKIGMTNNFAFGGVNCSLMVKKLTL
jgi:3-oxoacyl-[acyl-carrier-protein] synthase II